LNAARVGASEPVTRIARFSNNSVASASAPHLPLSGLAIKWGAIRAPREEQRIVGRDNVVTTGLVPQQLAKQRSRRTCAGCECSTVVISMAATRGQPLRAA